MSELTNDRRRTITWHDPMIGPRARPGLSGLDYRRAVRGDSGPLHCTGRVVKPGHRVIFGEATLTDRQGGLLATATSSLLTIDL